MHLAVIMLEGEAKFTHTIGPQFCNIFIWEFMKLVVKLRKENERSGMYVQCLTTVPEAKRKLQWCLCPMGGSVVYTALKA